jgi:hypothetical protein
MMKKNNLLLLCMFTVMHYLSFAQSINYDRLNVELLGKWDDTSVPKSSAVGNRYASCWGYAQNGREYAIIGASTGTFVLDVTQPENIKKIAFIKGAGTFSTWREYKTYKNYLYCVSDDDPIFHIVDLSYLPDSVKIVKTGTGLVHTVSQEGDQLYFNTGGVDFATGNGFSALSLKDDPTNPKLIASLGTQYPNYKQFHDSYIKNDTIYGSAENNGLAVFYLDKKLGKFSLLGTMPKYIFGGYNHSSVLLPDGKTLVMLDEVP